MSQVNIFVILGVFVFILLIDLLVSAVKSAMSHARLPYLFNLREKNAQDVDRTIKVIERPRIRTTLRIALILCHVLSAALLLMILIYYFKTLHWGVMLFMVGIGSLVLSVFEFLLEGQILKDPENAAIKLKGVGLFLDVLLVPLSKLMTFLLGEHASQVTLSTMTEEELKNWVEVGPAEGNLEKGERQMIYSIFHFGDTLTREVMVPRIDVLALDINSTIGEARKAFIDAGHSRVPVYEDTIDNVVGLLYAKDLLASLDDQTSIADNRHILRTAFFVPETKKVDELLAEMQKNGVHMTLVVDEYGGVAGVVTLEDIVEEIVGEIYDEYDQVEEQLFQKLSENDYNFLGRVPLDDFNDVTGLNIATDNADTLGGFLYGELGHIPAPGELVQAGGVDFVIEEVIGRRILKVRAHLQDVHLSETNNVDEKETTHAD